MRGYFDHQEAMERIYQEVKNSAYEIIQRKKATYYGIANAVRKICEVIVKDERAILPISTMMTGQFGIQDVCLSIPTVLGRQGVDMVVDMYLNNDEYDQLQSAYHTLKEVIDDLKL